jgi:hypothetical protein
MGYQKVKMQQWKEREKDFSDYCLAKRRAHFFGNEVLRKMCVNCAKLMPIIYIKGNCYETPLYGHVLGEKRNGYKKRGMRSGRSHKGGVG